ncbi:MAG: beta-N-acetylhexosaminidase [Pontixanthobacter sp.]
MLPAIFGLSGPVLTADERAFFTECDPAGYILFGRNCETPEQLRALTDSLRALHGRDRLLVSIDQEGGRVARLRPPHWSAFPAGEAFDRLYRIAPSSAIEAARLNGRAMGLELAEMGITVTYHPPLDVRQSGAHDVIGDRAFGDNPMQVAAIARATLDGLAKAGVTGCIKHMPGHGRASVDSHKSMPIVTATAGEMETDIAPFRTLSHAAIGMTAHLLYTAWDADRPATLSPTIIDTVIRGAIGFDGLLLTDDIDMEALSGTVPQRAQAAIAAGCDIVLNCWAKMDDMSAMAGTLPKMSTRAHDRLQTALSLDHEVDALPEKTQLLAYRDELLSIAV